VFVVELLVLSMFVEALNKRLNVKEMTVTEYSVVLMMHICPLIEDDTT
jgi:hypothetical protein